MQEYIRDFNKKRSNVLNIAVQSVIVHFTTAKSITKLCVTLNSGWRCTQIYPKVEFRVFLLGRSNKTVCNKEMSHMKLKNDGID